MNRIISAYLPHSEDRHFINVSRNNFIVYFHLQLNLDDLYLDQLLNHEQVRLLPFMGDYELYRHFS